MHRLYVLGRIDFRDPVGREVRTVVAQRKRLALLAYLAANAGTAGCRRERLLGLFWPELDEHRARKALNKAVHFLRREIGGDALVSRNGDEVEVDATRLWCDAVAFRSAMTAGDRARALDLYVGDLLPSFYVDDASAFDEWVEQERMRLRLAAADAARALAVQREHEGRATSAITLARRAAALADLDERVVRQLLALLDRLGDRAGALDVYDRFARRLADEFAAEPAIETKRLMAQIRGRNHEPPHERREVAVLDVRPTTTTHLTPHSDRALFEALRSRGYDIERELGRGATATVYLARDLRHARCVALKVLSPEIDALRHSKRFLTEIRVTAQLQHPNILPLFDSGDVNGVLFYVMPLVDGESLRTRLARDGRLGVTESVSLARVIAEALEHAHRRGVIHRDIKPENILLSGGHAHVVDFGIARAIAAPGSDVITQTGIVIGSPAYMSPEQAAADSTLDGRTDVYALGCVLYEMLVGTPPFSGGDNAAMLARHITDPVPSVRAARADVPRWLEDVLRMALAKSPADRWPTAGELADALSRQTPPVRTRRFGRVLAGSGLVAACLVALWGIGSLLRPSKSLDASLVAVAPFDLVGAANRHSEYREGLMELIAASMDGAGPLRSVPVSRVVKIWHSHGDAETGAGLGHATGARLVIYGYIVSGAGDSIRVTASLLDATSGGRRDFDIRDDASRLDRIADSLTLYVLRELGRARPIAAVRSAPLGSTSLPALRAFLAGEQFFRTLQRDSAEVLYSRAAEIDSGFALAWRRLAEVRSWTHYDGDSLINLYRNRAALLNHGLPARDSLLIVADSLLAALYTQPIDVSWREHRRRLYATLEAARERYPDDPEVWQRLGKVREDFPVPGGTRGDALDAYERVIRIDSSFSPGYGGVCRVSLTLDRPADARRCYSAWRAHVPAFAATEDARIIARLLDPTLERAERDRMIASASAEALDDVGRLFEVWADSAETSVLIARALVERHRGLPFDDVQTYVERLLDRGHVARAIAVQNGRMEELSPHTSFWRLSTLGVVPADVMYAHLDRAYRAGDVPGFGTLEFLLARRDTMGLLRYRRFADSIDRRARLPNRPPYVVRLDRYRLARADGYLALAMARSRDDSALALERFRDLADPECLGCFLTTQRRDAVIFARLLAARGRERDALTVLESNFLDYPWFEVERLMEVGRLATRLGDRNRALAAYGWVTHVWQHADPMAARYVTAAAAELARLEARGERAAVSRSLR